MPFGVDLNPVVGAGLNLVASYADKLVTALKEQPGDVTPLIALLQAAWLFRAFAPQDTAVQGRSGKQTGPTSPQWTLPKLGRFEMAIVLVRLFALLLTYGLFLVILSIFMAQAGSSSLVVLFPAMILVLNHLWVRTALRRLVLPPDPQSDNPPLARLLAWVAKTFPRLRRLGALAKGTFDRWLWAIVVVMIVAFVALTVSALGQFFHTLATPIVVILAWWAWNWKRPLTNRVYLFLVAAWTWIFVYASSYLIAVALGEYLKLLRL